MQTFKLTIKNEIFCRNQIFSSFEDAYQELKSKYDEIVGLVDKTNFVGQGKCSAQYWQNSTERFSCDWIIEPDLA